MRILIDGIADKNLKNLAISINNDEKVGNKNKYLDEGEISIFVNKVNESRKEGEKIETLLDFGNLLGLDIKEGKGKSRADYDLAKSLKNSIYYTAFKYIPVNKNTETKKLLNKITKDNVVYVLDQYKKISENDLAIDVDDEIGLDVTTVRDTICSKLFERAQELQLNIQACESDNIEEVNAWINNVAQKIEEVDVNALIIEKQEDRTIIYSAEDELAVSEIHYNDGRVIRETHDYDANGTVRVLTQPYGDDFLSNRKKKEGEVAETLNLNIEDRPTRTIAIPSGDPMVMPSSTIITDDYIKDMANELQSRKAELMELLNINNETYDKYAALVLAIAEYEVCHMGADIKLDNVLNELLQFSKKKVGDDNLSVGYTALKFNDIVDIVNRDTENKEYDKLEKYFKDNPSLIEGVVKQYETLLSNLNSFGINDMSDLTNSSKSAIATLLFIDARINMLEYICKNDPNQTRTETSHYDPESRVYASSTTATFEGVVAGIYVQGLDNFVDGTFNENEDNKYIDNVKLNYKKYSGQTN